MRTLTAAIALLFFRLLARVEAVAQYENQNYLPLTKTELSRTFRDSYLGTLGHGRPGYFEDQSDKPLPDKIGIGPSGAVITTTPEGRKVVAMSAGAETLQSGLNEIISDKCAVTLFGNRTRDNSSPELFWAVSTRKKL